MLQIYETFEHFSPNALKKHIADICKISSEYIFDVLEKEAFTKERSEYLIQSRSMGLLVDKMDVWLMEDLPPFQEFSEILKHPHYIPDIAKTLEYPFLYQQLRGVRDEMDKRASIIPASLQEKAYAKYAADFPIENLPMNIFVRDALIEFLEEHYVDPESKAKYADLVKLCARYVHDTPHVIYLEDSYKPSFQAFLNDHELLPPRGKIIPLW